MFFTVYKGHEIVNSGDHFRVKTPNNEYLPEVAASVATAKKWIDGIANEAVTPDPYNVDEFTRAYMECVLWSSTDVVNGDDVNLDDNHSIEDIAPETLGTMIADCAKFQLEYSAALKMAYAHSNDCQHCKPYDASSAGHDFWLTRNGNGAGFWDRGLGRPGEVLSEACGWRTTYPEIDLYIGDDGKIHA